MKHIFSILLFFSFFALKSQSGIEPSSFQATPYENGILKGVIPIVDEFTGETVYLYQHDTLGLNISDIFIDSDSIYFVIGTDTINIGSINDNDSDPTNELPVINLVFDELDLPSTPCKTGDWATDGVGTWWVCETDAPSWSLVSQAQLIEITFQSLAGDSIYVYRVDVSGNASTFALKVDNTLKLSNLVGAPTTAVIKVDTSIISTIVNVKNLISDSLATIVFPRDSTTVLGGTGITAWESPANTWNIQNDDPDQTVTLTPTGIISISGAYPNFTIGATEADGDPNNEKQTLSQSFTGST